MGSSVYIVSSPDPDCDMFQYGSLWYVYYSGYWYRSNRYAGPFVAGASVTVAGILTLPSLFIG